MLEALSASFDATIAREENQSASDLAFSLRQNRLLIDVLPRLGAAELCLPDGARACVSVVGNDYLGAGDPIELAVPASRAVLVQGGLGGAAERRRESLAMVLRGWGRQGLKVQVDTGCGTLGGLVGAVGSDHIQLQTRLGWALVNLASVDALRVARGGSAGAL